MIKQIKGAKWAIILSLCALLFGVLDCIFQEKTGIEHAFVTLRPYGGAIFGAWVVYFLNIERAKLILKQESDDKYQKDKELLDASFKEKLALRSKAIVEDGASFLENAAHILINESIDHRKIHLETFEHDDFEEGSQFAILFKKNYIKLQKHFKNRFLNEEKVLENFHNASLFYENLVNKIGNIMGAENISNNTIGSALGKHFNRKKSLMSESEFNAIVEENKDKW